MSLPSIRYVFWHGWRVDGGLARAVPRLHQPRHALATHTDAVIISQFGVDVRRAIHAPRAAVDRLDLPHQPQIHPRPFGDLTLQPRIKAFIDTLSDRNMTPTEWVAWLALTTSAPRKRTPTVAAATRIVPV